MWMKYISKVLISSYDSTDIKKVLIFVLKKKNNFMWISNKNVSSFIVWNIEGHHIIVYKIKHIQCTYFPETGRL